MDETLELKIKAYKAFLNIHNKLAASSYQLDLNFLNRIAEDYAPLDYIETHYNYHKEIEQYTLAAPSLHVFDGDLEICHPLDLPTTYIGDVHVKGSIEIAADSTVMIVGDLIVDNVITCGLDAILFVAGTIKAKGLKVEASVTDFSICAEKVEITDVLYAKSFIHAGEVKSKLLLAEGFSLQLNKSNELVYQDSVITKTQSTYSFFLPIADSSPIRNLFHPALFNERDQAGNIWDLTYDIFYALKHGMIIADANNDYRTLESIFKA